MGTGLGQEGTLTLAVGWDGPLGHARDRAVPFSSPPGNALTPSRPPLRLGDSLCISHRRLWLKFIAIWAQQEADGKFQIYLKPVQSETKTSQG